MVLVSYDVRTTSGGGKRRLRRLARACRDYGQRVQFLVFEIELDFAQWAVLKNRLCELIDPELDSLRFYYLGTNWKRSVEQVGAKQELDLNGALIF